MPITVTFNVGALPNGFCPTTWQQTFQGFVNALTGTVNGLSSTGITVSTTAPSAATAPNLWLQVTAQGVPIALYTYTSFGDWEPVNPPFFFPGLTDSGVVNAYKSTVSPFPTSITPAGSPTSGLIKGMTFVFKAAATNTGASTYQVNAYAAAPILSGTTALYPGAIVINDWYMVMWDGTNFQLLNSSNVSPGTVDGQIYTTREIAVGPPAIFQAQWETRVYATPVASYGSIPAPGSAATLSHGLTVNGSPVTPAIYQCRIICTDAGGDVSYSQNDEVDWEDIYITVASEVSNPTTYVNQTTLGFVRSATFSAGAMTIDKKDGSGFQVIAEAKWKIKAGAMI